MTFAIDFIDSITYFYTLFFSIEYNLIYTAHKCVLVFVQHFSLINLWILLYSSFINIRCQHFLCKRYSLFNTEKIFEDNWKEEASYSFLFNVREIQCQRTKINLHLSLYILHFTILVPCVNWILNDFCKKKWHSHHVYCRTITTVWKTVLEETNRVGQQRLIGAETYLQDISEAAKPLCTAKKHTAKKVQIHVKVFVHVCNLLSYSGTSHWRPLSFTTVCHVTKIQFSLT